MEMVTILGAGNFGTALANIIAGNGHLVRLWTIEEDVYWDMKKNRRNTKYQPDMVLAPGIEAHMDLKEALTESEIIVIAVPSTVVRGLVKKVLPLICDKQRILVDLAKGLEADTFLRMSQVIEEEMVLSNTLQHRIIALSGPSIAKEVGAGTPTVVMIASAHQESAYRVQETMASKTFNMYLSQDVIGLELGGVFKNIIALLIGMCDGKGLGINTKAALMVCLLEEIRDLGEALGADPLTFYGLAGLGDIIATSMSPSSRNHTLGEKIGQGKTLEEAREEMFMVTEGVEALQVACQAADRLGLHLPLIKKEHDVLFGASTLDDFISFFMCKKYDAPS